MRAGNLKRKVIFFPKVVTRDDYNSSVDTWPEEGEDVNVIETRGEITYSSGNKELSGEQRFFSKVKELTVRYRSDIEETMRIQLDSESDRYEITSNIEEIGRKVGLRMTIEKLKF